MGPCHRHGTQLIKTAHTQCCGTGTAGTVTFCLCGTRTGKHYGSGTGFGPESNIKCNKKSKKQKGEAKFLGNNAAFDIEKARLCKKNLLLKNCAKLCLDPEPELEQQPEQKTLSKSELEPQ
jgi:hypothetical protein